MGARSRAPCKEHAPRSPVALNPGGARGHQYGRGTSMDGPRDAALTRPARGRGAPGADEPWPTGGHRGDDTWEARREEGVQDAMRRERGAEAGDGAQCAIRVGAWVRPAPLGRAAETEACRQGDADAYPERRVVSLFGVLETPLRTGVRVSMRVRVGRSEDGVRRAVVPEHGGGVVNETRSGRGEDAFEPARAGKYADRIDVK